MWVCSFCVVGCGKLELLFDDEFEWLVFVVERFGLKYVVIIFVFCDDLLDGGVEYFYCCV